MVSTTDNTPQGQRPEQMFLDVAERVARNPQGWLGAVLHFSRLSAPNRTEQRVRMAMRLIESVTRNHENHIFVFSDRDVGLLVKGMRLADLDGMVYRLRALFANDPLIYQDTGAEKDPFCTWYEGGRDAEALVRAARDRQARTGEAPAGGGQQGRGARATPIDPDALERILTSLEARSVTPAVRRQPVIAFREESRGSVLFVELFYAVRELQRMIAPDVDLPADRWLFQELSRTLDRKMLQEMEDLSLHHWPPELSLNLNLSTLEEGGLERLEKLLRANGVKLALEFQVIDVFADLDRYFRQRDRLRERGHRVILDGLSQMTFQFVNVEELRPDMVKLMWTPELGTPGAQQKGGNIDDHLAEAGVENVILARCDSETAIRWGRDRGIACFQGYYVDTIMAAMTKAACGADCVCAINDISRRRERVTPDRGADCNRPDLIDTLPDVRVPARGKPKAKGKG